MVKSHKARLAVQQVLVDIQPEVAIFIKGNHMIVSSTALAQHLPGDKIRMMIHHCKNHFIARVNEHLSKRIRHQVNGFCCAACEDDFVLMFGVDVALHGSAGGFMCFCSQVREVMCSAMDIAVIAGVIIHDRIDHRLRLLGCGGIVQVNQGLPVHPGV